MTPEEREESARKIEEALQRSDELGRKIDRELGGCSWHEGYRQVSALQGTRCLGCSLCWAPERRR